MKIILKSFAAFAIAHLCLTTSTFGFIEYRDDTKKEKGRGYVIELDGSRNRGELMDCSIKINREFLAQKYKFQYWETASVRAEGWNGKETVELLDFPLVFKDQKNGWEVATFQINPKIAKHSRITLRGNVRWGNNDLAGVYEGNHISVNFEIDLGDYLPK